MEVGDSSYLAACWKNEMRGLQSAGWGPFALCGEESWVGEETVRQCAWALRLEAVALDFST
jgi:hypothetical protein